MTTQQHWSSNTSQRNERADTDMESAKVERRKEALASKKPRVESRHSGPEVFEGLGRGYFRLFPAPLAGVAARDPLLVRRLPQALTLSWRTNTPCFLRHLK